MKNKTRYYLIQVLLFLPLMLLSKHSFGQKIDKRYIDDWIRKCDNTFNDSKPNIYVVNGLLYEGNKLDSVLQTWTVSDLRTIDFASSSDQWKISIGRLSESWIIQITGKGYRNKKIEKRLFKEAKDKLLRNPNPSSYPLLWIDNHIYEGTDAVSEILKIRFSRIKNIEFHKNKIHCLVGRETDNGLIKIWTISIKR